MRLRGLTPELLTPELRGTLRVKIEALYRDCQRFATDEIDKLVAEVNLDFSDERTLKSKD